MAPSPLAPLLREAFGTSWTGEHDLSSFHPVGSTGHTLPRCQHSSATAFQASSQGHGAAAVKAEDAPIVEEANPLPTGSGMDTDKAEPGDQEGAPEAASGASLDDFMAGKNVIHR